MKKLSLALAVAASAACRPYDTLEGVKDTVDVSDGAQNGLITHEAQITEGETGTGDTDVMVQWKIDQFKAWAEPILTAIGPELCPPNGFNCEPEMNADKTAFERQVANVFDVSGIDDVWNLNLDAPVTVMSTPLANQPQGYRVALVLGEHPELPDTIGLMSTEWPTAWCDIAIQANGEGAVTCRATRDGHGNGNELRAYYYPETGYVLGMNNYGQPDPNTLRLFAGKMVALQREGEAVLSAPESFEPIR